jgi:hypothetical protein
MSTKPAAVSQFRCSPWVYDSPDSKKFIKAKLKCDRIQWREAGIVKDLTDDEEFPARI